MVVTAVSLGFLISVPSPQSPWPLGLRSDLLLTCDLLCRLYFLQGLLFKFRRKKHSATKIIRMLRSAATRYIVDRAMACSCSLLTSSMTWPISAQAVSKRTLCCDYRECRFVCAPQAGFRPAHQCRKPVGECFACRRVST